MNSFHASSAPGAPLVSVIVASYNYGHFLDETLSSVQKQTFTDWECIVVDDGSTDETREIVCRWSERDARFRYLHQFNSGSSAARNAGIMNARGVWLQFLDADDLLASSSLEIALEYSRTNADADIICGQFVFMAQDGSSFWQWPKVRSRINRDDAFGDILASWEKGLMIALHAVLFRRECFERWGNWDETLATHEDWELQLRFAAKGARYFCHENVVAAYRKHNQSAAGNSTKMRQGFLKVMLHLLQLKSVARRHKPLIAFRFLEECFKTILLKLQGRDVDLKAVYFDADTTSPCRAWLLALFVLTFPVLLFLKMTNTIRVRIASTQGKNARVDYASFE